MPASCRIPVFILFVLAAVARAQVLPLHVLGTGGAGDRCGAALTFVGDVDLDGVADVALGAPLADGGGVDAGAVHVYSGATGALLASVFGLAANDRLGTAVAALGDVDLDGTPDLAVGAPRADSNGTDSGSVYVISGRWIRQIAQLMAPTGPAILLTVTGDAAGERYGSALAAAGDVDADGFGDLLVGAPFASAALPAEGRFEVLSGAWLSQAIIGGPAVAEVLLGAAGPGLSTQLGSALAALGDLDGDGFDDVLVGAPFANQPANPLPFVGRASVYRGGATPMGAALPFLSVYGTATSSRFGATLAGTGDVNGDGTPDFVVGAPDYSATVPPGPGRVRLISGEWVVSTAASMPTATAQVLYTWDGLNPQDGFGSALANAGDVDADGFPDLMIGTPFRDPAGGIDAGLVQVYSGEWLATTIANGTPLTDQIIYSFAGATAGDEVGFALAGGPDLNGDGGADFVFGLPSRDVVGFPDRGAAHVVSLLDPAIVASLAGDATNDWFGDAVGALGDIDGDGVGDYLIGARRADDPGTGNVDAGSVTVISGATATVLTVLRGAAAGDEFGVACNGVGDVNGDGIDDFIVGAYLSDVTASGAGTVYVFSGEWVASTAAGTTPATSRLLFTFQGDVANDLMGIAVAGAGDVDNDGVPDLMAGAERADPNGADSGLVRIWSGVGGTVLATLPGTAAGDRFGTAVDGVGDLNGDGFDDVLIGARQADVSASNAGQARVYSGEFITRTALGLTPTSPQVLYTFNGTLANASFGSAVSGAGDVDNDGVPDLLIGARGTTSGGLDAGSVAIQSGVDGSLLATFAGAAGERLGDAVRSAGDVNGDGFDDVVVGARSATGTAGALAGRIVVYSGEWIAATAAAVMPATQQILYTLAGDDAGDELGTDVIGIGDVTGDGLPNILVGVPRDDTPTIDAGRALVIRVPVDPPTYPGSGEDLVIATGVNGTPDRLQDVKTAMAGDLLLVRFDSLLGHFDQQPHLLVGQLFTTGTPPVPPAILPSIHLDFGAFPQPAVLYSSYVSTPLWLTPQIPPDGLLLAYQVQPGFAGKSVMLQAVAITVMAANGFLAATNGHEIVIQP